MGVRGVLRWGLTQELLVLLDLAADVGEAGGWWWPRSHPVGHSLHLLDGLQPGGGTGAVQEGPRRGPGEVPGGVWGGPGGELGGLRGV